jgi:hypothetical protein
MAIGTSPAKVVVSIALNLGSEILIGLCFRGGNLLSSECDEKQMALTAIVVLIESQN